MNAPIYFSRSRKKISVDDILNSPEIRKVRLPEAFKRFLEHAFLRTQENDFWQAGARLIFERLSKLWAFIQQRQKNQIHIHHFVETQSTLFLISQADASFIVDSLQIALQNLNLTYSPILSIGGLQVLRDHDGELLDILPEDHTLPECLVEDPILIHIRAPLEPEKIENIQRALTRALNEVHLVHNDQHLMREKCQAIIEELYEHKRHIPSEETREAITFLKWLLEDHFYFFGYREYSFKPGKEASINLVDGSGLGLLRNESHAVKKRLVSSMPPQAQHLTDPNFVLVITETNTESRVHRKAYTTYLSVKRFGKDGQIIGECRFIGLFPRATYHESIKHIPFLRQKTNAILAMSKAPLSGHLGKSILHILENFPRDDMFQMQTEELYQMVMAILNIYESNETRLLIRKDAYGKFYSCLVYLPKTKITSSLSKLFGEILLEAFQSKEISMTMSIDEGALARLHYIIRVPAGHRSEQEVDFKALETKVISASKGWQENLRELLQLQNSQIGLEIFNRYANAFSLGYHEDFSPEDALQDINFLEDVRQGKQVAINLYQTKQGTLNFKLFQQNQPTTLSEIIPILENMGLETIQEDAYKVTLENERIWICCYELRIRDNDQPKLEVIKPLFTELFFAVRDGLVENDSLNSLVLKCEISWHLVGVLRAYCSYARLIGVYSQTYLEKVLTKNFKISEKLLALFVARFDPTETDETKAGMLKTEIKTLLASVTHLEEDKILRSFLALIEASLRTNYYQREKNGNPKSYLSFKLQSGKIPNLPLPVPLYEIFVHSPRFEAIHLRAAKVARGGIRWSDRYEDFRTEVLGLMKAQQVKNAVIVPAGSKGGFILKRNTENMDRNTLQNEAISCYKDFMRGLLDLTDNLVDGKVIAPPSLRIYDEEDPYLVVAADKGTATFSDYANEVSLEYHFWLGDAFASGGSHGYDHKKIGITAKGAWISVKTHLKTLGINPEENEFTAIGIGDMSGDVFGNGMLLSRHMKLLAAFNHMHIFVDPNPNAATSFKERERLFNLPRSSWADYNTKLLSKGGQIFERRSKSIRLTEEIKTLFGLQEDEVEPNTLIRAILMSKVDLLFNGGIGTYVKASSERNQEVGDKTNDSLRVNANDLQCRCVGEGGNLGFTQLGRVEYAQKGGLIFTDFIDNSAGVDLSDHEVNIKILLAQALLEKQLASEEKRNTLLSTMTEAVANLVYKDNTSQTEILSYSSAQSTHETEIYARCIQDFEARKMLNRSVEFLPSDSTLEERIRTGKGLTAPEIAVIMAYVKMEIKHNLLNSYVPDSRYFQSWINQEFPEILTQNYAALMPKHQLHREIISTQLSNQMMNEAGVVFIQRLQEETNASVSQIVLAYSIVRAAFQLSKIYESIRALDFQISQVAQNNLRKHLMRFLRRATRWMIRHEMTEQPIETTLEKLNSIQGMIVRLPEMLHGLALEKHQRLIKIFTEEGTPEKLAIDVSNTYSSYLLLDINDIAQKISTEPSVVAHTYFIVGQKLSLDWLRDDITNQSVVNRWEALAHSSNRDGLDKLQAKLTVRTLKQLNPQAESIEADIAAWVEAKKMFYDAWTKILLQCQHATKRDYVMYSVALNVLDSLVDQLEKHA